MESRQHDILTLNNDISFKSTNERVSEKAVFQTIIYKRQNCIKIINSFSLLRIRQTVIEKVEINDKPFSVESNVHQGENKE